VGKSPWTCLQRQLVRTVKEIQPARDTYLLLSAEQGTDQDNKRKSASQKDLPTIKWRARKSSGLWKKVNWWWALTNYQSQQEELVKKVKEIWPEEGTYLLSSAKRGTDQDSERKPASEKHSPIIKHSARDLSWQQYKACLQRALTNY
jgi:hypothetical protein